MAKSAAESRVKQRSTMKNQYEIQILNGDSRKLLASIPVETVQCCVTSPPYWGLRDYDHDAQIGAESSPE